MPSTKNVTQLEKINKHLDTYKTVIVVDYAGLTVPQQQDIKRKAQETDSQFAVTKNTLLSLAIEDKAPQLLTSLSDTLKGPTAVLYTKDPVTGAKILTEFQKEHENFEIKLGFTLKNDSQAQDKILTQEEILTLSKLPSKEELYAQLLAQLQAPISSFTRLIDSPVKYLVYALSAVKDNKAQTE